MKARKAIAAVLTAVMLACVSGCGKQADTPSDTSQSVSTTSNESTSTTSDTSSSAESTSTSEDTDITEEPETVIPTAAEIVSQMRVGWNLGNTLDALGGGDVGSETAWGNPVTTKEMIDRVKEAGFNVLRVPVTWGTHVDADFNIDTAWLDRVQEVVDYGIDNDMFVILNTHHEEWYMPDNAHAEEDIKHLEKLWTQIAERFKDYDEKLLFEGVNEPRLRNTGDEWTGSAEAREVVNRYAETFVRAVRATGGNNAERSLLITPYSASSMSENLRALRVPENAGNIIVSVHAYLPYNFALNTQGTSVYENDGSINYLMNDIKTIFLDNNIPVVITEFGAMNKNNTDDRLRCVEDFLTAAKAINVPCLWWDNNYKEGEGETFGLLDRNGNGWFFPELVDKIMSIVGE